MTYEKEKKAVIIGAGPAGLTVAYELLTRTDIKPVVLEMSSYFGGISKTVVYKGNRIDIGGHRFFSKSDRVMDWWKNIMPLQLLVKHKESGFVHDNKQNCISPESADLQQTDKVFLIRNRLSRIYFLRKFFDYPISLSFFTLRNLGLFRIIKIGLSYVFIRLFPKKNEKSLEDFFINRFGEELYKTFFKDYTQKVWGVPCAKISSEWGAQRVKGLSVTKAILHAFKYVFNKTISLSQKDVETSLIERFMYPKYGPGQLWEEVAKQIIDRGGEIHLNHKVTQVSLEGNKINSVVAVDEVSNQNKIFNAEYFFSTMPVKDLILNIKGEVPSQVKEVASGLIYRDFITIGLLLKKLKIQNETNTKTINNIPPDNWIYIQENDVKIGRLQIFNNWSPYMVLNPETVWIGLEYFCNEGDELWNKTDSELIELGISELSKIDIILKEDVLDGTVIRIPKTYPAYFGTYDRFDEIKEFVNCFDNLFLIGRNGMHKYNNQDHSMLTAMIAVDNIVNNIKEKNNIWEVNTEEYYHEEKK